MTGRLINISDDPEAGCSPTPVILDGKKLYAGLMVHASGNAPSLYRACCGVAVVLEFTPDGVCRLAFMGGAGLSKVPYKVPDPGNPGSYSWHYIDEGADP